MKLRRGPLGSIGLIGTLMLGCQPGVLNLNPNDGSDVVDEDGDGFGADEDCDDNDPEINPGADERASGEADGVDDDCNGYPDDVEVCEGTSEEYETIQSAIDDVPTDFLIRVCPGVYPENLTISQRRVNIMGIEGAAETIVDGEQRGSALRVNDVNGVSIEGLTFTNGSSDGLGGGILCQESSLALTGVVVSDSVAEYGGGLGAKECDLTIEDSTFSDNGSVTMGGGAYLEASEGTITASLFTSNESLEGGGLALFESEITVESNEFTENVATTTDEEIWGPGGGGGGIWSFGDSDLIDNLIHHNTSHYHGGGFYQRQSRPEIRGNDVYDNLCHEDGAGGYVNRGRAEVRDNTFSNNTAYDDAGGFRVYIGRLIIEDNTLVGNSAGDDAGGMKLSHSSNTIRRNVFEGNRAGDAGGGLELDNETSDVVDCQFIDNEASRGAGLHSWRNEGTLTIESSVFEGNRAGYCGGAIQMDNNPYEVLLHNLTVLDNTSDRDGAAICTEMFYQDAENTVSESAIFRMTNSVVAWNRAGDDGGAFYVKAGEMTLVNVTAHGNTANDDGGGIAMKEDSVAVVVNTLITRSGAEGIYIEEEYEEGDIPSAGVVITYSDVWGSDDENYQGMDDPTGMKGNISENPRYVDAEGNDFSLRDSSAAVDAGDPTLEDKDGSESDMGATGGPDAP